MVRAVWERSVARRVGSVPFLRMWAPRFDSEASRQLPSWEEERRRGEERGERDDEGKAEDRVAAEERGEEPEAERFAARGESGRPQGRLSYLQGAACKSQSTCRPLRLKASKGEASQRIGLIHLQLTYED